MGLFDSLESMAASALTSSGSDQAKVAGGLMQTLQQHPDGIGGILQSFQANGMGEHATAMANGDATPASPEQVQQGLSGSGILEQVAEKAGVSPQVAAMAMSTVLPMVLAHFAPNGQATPQNQMASMAGGFLQKFL